MCATHRCSYACGFPIKSDRGVPAALVDFLRLPCCHCLMSSIGARIREARQRKRLTQGQLGKALGVSLRTVGNWERDEVMPQNRKAVEDFLGIDLNADLEVREVPPPAGAGAARALYASFGAETSIEKLRVLQQLMDDVLKESGGGGRG